MNDLLEFSAGMVNPARATILVVDDDPGVRAALHLILDDQYEVIDAADGDEAITAVASRKIDLILLDLVMARSDGFEFLERRREEHKNVPVIVLSGLNNAWAATTAARMGALDYLTKPFEEDYLLGVVRDTLCSRAGSAAAPRGSRKRMRSVLLVGLDLGTYASLVVLLRLQCEVVRAETMIEALGTAEAAASCVVINLPSLGPHAPALLPQLRSRFTNAEFVVVAADGRSCVASTILKAPARVTDLFVALRRLPAPGNQTQLPSARVSSILDQLGAGYVSASVKRLARAIGSAPGYLSTCFRQEIGLSLKTYMIELRLEVAKWLLLEAGEKIETVAVRIRLHDASHLSRLFVRYAGTRPGAYRKNVIPAS